jgi:hypothetical protein
VPSLTVVGGKMFFWFVQGMMIFKMKECINKYCPRSGKSVSEDALAQYRGFIVGFCNTGCRDNFASNAKNCPSDRSYFDVIIKEIL